jgi:muramoyltetrapeptide carboxypeptidase
MTLRAKPLPEGGTIGVSAPASPYDGRSEILRGVEWWEKQGYRVKLAPGVFERDDYVAGDAKQRAADLNALFADPEVDVVQTLQGGFGSAQAIPYLDFDTIATIRRRRSSAATDCWPPCEAKRPQKSRETRTTRT